MARVKVDLDPVTVKRTVASFRGFDKAVEDRVGNLLLQTGFSIQRDAKRAAPVMFGFLRASIYADYKRRELAVENWSSLEYAPFVEFGTGTKVSIPSGYESFASQFRRGPGVNREARPYLIPAFEYHGSRAIEAIDKIIERESKR